MQDKNLSFKYIFTRLFKNQIYPFKNKISFAILCMVIVAIASTFNVWLVKPALDKIFLNRDSEMLIYIPLIIILVSLIKATAAYFENYIMKYVGQRIITNMQMELYSHLLEADLEFLHNYSSAKLISKFTNDINIVRGSVSNLLTSLVKESLSVIFLVILMFYTNITLSLVAFFVFPLAILPIIRVGKRMRKISGKTQEEIGNFSATLDDSLGMIKIVKSYRAEEFEKNRARIIIEKIFDLYLKAIRTGSFASPIIEAISGIGIAAVIWYGGMQVINNVTTPGAFFSFIVAFISAYKPVKSLADINTNIQEGLSAAKRIFDILDVLPKIHDSKIASNMNNGDIIFDDVTFIYPNGKIATSRLSLIVPKGKTIALVGTSGGGKSTIINLLLRFYDINTGSIKIDNKDIRDIKLSSLRDNIALITQEAMLFDDNIKANIAYSNPEISFEDIIQAAKRAAAHDFIMELPNGYDTVIGQHGMKLSGGQRQRISIARAIIKNSPILILDEATSSLDNLSEIIIQKSLDELQKDKTTIIIAHRLSTIINADLVYVINNGGVIESGNHQELINKEGEYFKLYSKEK